MYCKNCGEKLEDTVEVCPKCHTQLRKNKKIEVPIKKFVTYAIATIILIVLLVVLLRPAKPEDVADKFLSALLSGNYSKAYDMLYIENQNGTNVFLTKQDFIKAMKDMESEKGKIKEVSLDVQEELNNLNETLLNLFGTNEIKRQYSKEKYREYVGYIKREGNNSEEALQLFLLNLGSKRRPNWKIIANPLIQTRTVSTFPEIKVMINDREINPQSPGVYVYKCFEGWRAKYKLTSDLIKTIETEDSDYNVVFMEFEPSETLRKRLINLINDFNKASIQAEKELNPSYYEPYVSKKSSFLGISTYDKLASIINEMKLNNYYFESTLVDIKYGDMKFVNGLNEVHFDVEETWTSIKKKLDDKTVLEERPPYTIKWRYKIVQENGQWVIYDHWTI